MQAVIAFFLTELLLVGGAPSQTSVRCQVGAGPTWSGVTARYQCLVGIGENYFVLEGSFYPVEPPEQRPAPQVESY